MVYYGTTVRSSNRNHIPCSSFYGYIGAIVISLTFTAGYVNLPFSRPSRASSYYKILLISRHRVLNSAGINALEPGCSCHPIRSNYRAKPLE